MSNDYFIKTGAPASRASLSSSAIRAEFAAIEAAFDLMPDLTGNANEVIVVNSGATGLTSVPITGSVADTGSVQTFTNKTFVAPALGTPASGVLSNCTFPTFGVTQGGTGRTTGTTAYALIATGSTATGIQQSLAVGATTEVLVGGGASALPVWTTATGSGAPVRATSPTITTPTITNYTETLYAPAAGSAWTVDLANGTVQKFTTNANATITLPASAAGKSYQIIVTYGGTHTLTFAGGTSIKYPAGVAPTATSANGKIDIYAVTCDGTHTYIRDGGRAF